MNEALLQNYTPEEVKLALNSIGDLKAPGLDGMPAAFYKQYWELIGDKVTVEVLVVRRCQKIGMRHVSFLYPR